MEYKGKMYDTYDTVKEFLIYSGKKADRLVYLWEIKTYEFQEIPNLIGQYLVAHRGNEQPMPIMPIISYVHAMKPILELPIGHVRVEKKKLKRVKGLGEERNKDFDFIASFILSGNLLASYYAAYKQSRNHQRVLHKFFDILNKESITDRVLDFMAKNNMGDIFKTNGMELGDLIKLWKEKLMSEKSTAKDLKEAVEYIKQMSETENQTKAHRMLPDIPVRQIPQG